jgi:dipeptidyl aminopeptidase/acylaminoacyl peptidase
VLQPNYRGSTGAGTAFARHGREWGLAMQDDLADAAAWLVAQGIADANRIGIYGVGYGGYAALEALVKTPEVFRAGASFAGWTDLALARDHARDETAGALVAPFVGDAAADDDALAARSPARHVDRIRAPVLVAHGTQDPIVPVEQAKAMIGALEEAKKPVESSLYRDELHGFVDERNRIDFAEKLAAFFAHHLSAAPARPAR